MTKISIDNHNAVKGSIISVQVEHKECSKYQQMQIDVFDAGKLNRTLAISKATTPQETKKNVYTMDIGTSDLSVGFYEIGIIKFHTPKNPDIKDNLLLLPKDLSGREVFRVTEDSGKLISKEQIIKILERIEHRLEKQFASAVRVSNEKKVEAFAVFVFVRDLLIGTRMRLSKYEVIPTNLGLEARDSYDFVNAFFKNNTKTNAHFDYTDSCSISSKQSNPVSVIHFPNIEALNIEQARDYCAEKSNQTILALNLIRDAGGQIFDITVLSHETRQAINYFVPNNYAGNLLTGGLSGESHIVLQKYLVHLEESDFNKFLLELFKEARREKHTDFQFIRLWQIMELLAQHQNYTSAHQLLDYEGKAILQDNQEPRLLRGSLHTVYALLRDSKYGDSLSTWENVNIWFALRSAVAHFGAISSFKKLTKASTREWAGIAFKETGISIAKETHLRNLREAVKFLLAKRLS